MQQIQFIREGMNNYMIISCQHRLDRTSYGDTILELVEVPGFMNYEIREIDGEQILYYKLKYRTSLKQVLGDLSFTFSQVKNMISSIIDILKQTEEYLLNQDYVVWSSDCTFIEINTGNLVFTYQPEKENKIDSLKTFLMELMQYIDKKDQHIYMFVLEFYNLVTNPGCTLEQLVEYVEENVKEEQNGCLFVSSDCEQEALDQYHSLQDEKNERQERKKSFFVVSALTIINLLVVICLICEIWTYQYIWVLIVTVFLLLISLIIYFHTDSEDNPDKIMEEYMRKQDIEVGNYDYYFCNDVPTETETTILTMTNVKQEIVVEDKPRELYLRAMEQNEYQDIVIKKDNLLIGSMTNGCDYVLRERGISRMHAKILKREDGLYLLDMNSTNGTFLNDKLIDSGKEYLICEGDVIAFAYVATFVVEVK